MTDREKTNLDRHITGEGAMKRTLVEAECINGHTWSATMTEDMGAVEVEPSACPTCGAMAEDYETEDDDE